MDPNTVIAEYQQMLADANHALAVTRAALKAAQAENAQKGATDAA